MLEHEDLLLEYRTAVSVPEAGDTRDELEKYMPLPLTEQTALQFWKSEKIKLPRMATIDSRCWQYQQLVRQVSGFSHFVGTP